MYRPIKSCMGHVTHEFCHVATCMLSHNNQLNFLCYQKINYLPATVYVTHQERKFKKNVMAHQA